MARTGSKTVRFAQIVERSGQPQVHTLWLPPEKDPELKRAQKAHRVMTVMPGGGGKTDVGFIGFDPAHPKNGQFLIFPKSLKAFEGARVVGIKFDLVAQPKLAKATALKNAAVPVRQSARRTSPPSADPAGKRRRRRTTNDDDKIVSFGPPPAASYRPPAQLPRSIAPSTVAAKATRHRPAATRTLIREVRAAMKELKTGKSVAAYQRLERAVSRT